MYVFPFPIQSMYVWYIYLHFMVNVGKYTSHMDGMCSALTVLLALPSRDSAKVLLRQRPAFPALAMDRRPPRLCFNLKFSSANFSPRLPENGHPKT